MQHKTFFASDHHFMHANVLKYANRPFSSVTEMGEELIKRHNAKVSPQDLVYFVGDFVFSNDPLVITKILKRLNGNKIFVGGNHDKGMFHPDIIKCFASFHATKDGFKSLKIRVNDTQHPKGFQDILLSHFPYYSWDKSHYGTWNLFGHEHGNLSHFENSQQLDIGVDCWDYAPVEYNEVKQKLKTLKPFNVLHH